MFSKILTVLFFLRVSNAVFPDSCFCLTNNFLGQDIGLRDGSIATCGNLHLLKSVEVTNGNECAIGKIDHKDSVYVNGNASTCEEFVSGQGSCVTGDVVSAGNIKTKPKEWASSILGTAQDYTLITDMNCQTTNGKCLFGSFVDNGSKKILNETSSRKQLLRRQQNIHVPNGQAYTWTPGTYGKVDFGYQSVITIGPGQYCVDHLEIKNQVTFQFVDLSFTCSSPGEPVVYIDATRSIDIERDFQMVGVSFGGFSPCWGTYGVLWTSCADISIKQSKYPFYGAVVANQKIDVERLNTVYGCIAGQTGVDIKTGVTLNPMGPFGCECETKKKL